MRGIFARAWSDMLAFFGISQRAWWRMATVGVAIGIGTIGSVYLFRGRGAAVIESWDFVYALVPTVLIVLVVLIVHLWLAPIRMLNDERSRTVEILPIDPKAWERVKLLQLSEAACLWVDIEPHYPIVDRRAQAAYFQLPKCYGDRRDSLLSRLGPGGLGTRKDHRCR